MKTKKLDIIYEDKELLVINKPSKLPTIKTEKSNNSLYEQASAYVKKQYPKNKIFIVHRLDKDTSGVVLFAKNEEVKRELQNNWNEITKREYLAIVEGKVLKQEETLKNYLKEDKYYKIHVVEEKTKDFAITKYQVLNSKSFASLLKININTGKKHQIRVQLKEIKHPIIGDKLYGSTKNNLGRMGLHASVLRLKWKGKIYNFKAKIPKEFKLMFPNEIKRYEEEI